MREDLSFVDRVHRDLRAVRWAEPAEIRGRARRRTRRTTLLSAVTVLAVMSGSAYAVAGRPAEPAPPPVAAPPAPVAPLTRAEIPQDALLSPRDLRTATGVRLSDSSLGETVRVDPLLRSCGDERGLPATGPMSRYSRSQTLLRPAASRRAPTAAALSQDVYRVDPAQGRLLFGEIDMLLNACPEWRLTGSILSAGRALPIDTVHRWEVSVSDFAGDQSVLLRHVSLAPRGRADGKPVGPAGPIEITIVVRVGDLVTVIVPGPGTLADTVDGMVPGLSYADLETLGRTAARRLCPAANPSC